MRVSLDSFLSALLEKMNALDGGGNGGTPKKTTRTHVGPSHADSSQACVVVVSFFVCCNYRVPHEDALFEQRSAPGAQVSNLFNPVRGVRCVVQ